jgi:hypothetical protein
MSASGDPASRDGEGMKVGAARAGVEGTPYDGARDAKGASYGITCCLTLRMRGSEPFPVTAPGW